MTNGTEMTKKTQKTQSGSLLGNIVNLGKKALTSTGLLKKGLDIGSRAISS